MGVNLVIKFVFNFGVCFIDYIYIAKDFIDKEIKYTKTKQHILITEYTFVLSQIIRFVFLKKHSIKRMF